MQGLARHRRWFGRGARLQLTTIARNEEGRSRGTALFFNPGAEERLAPVAVGHLGHAVGPGALLDCGARRCRTRLSIPAHLLHVVVKLKRLPIGIEQHDVVIHARGEFRRNLGKAVALLAEERDGIAKLLVIGDLQAEEHRRRVVGKAELFAQGHRGQRQRMVFGAVAQEMHLLAVHRGDHCRDEAEVIAVEGERCLDVLHEQADRPHLYHAEGPRHADALHVVVEFEMVFLVAIARHQIDALLDRILDFLEFADLGQGRNVVEFTRIHRRGLGTARPADLLDPVIKLVDVAVRILNVSVPVRPRHVAARTHHRLPAFGQPVMAVHHFLEAADLPGQLVDGIARPEALAFGIEFHAVAVVVEH